MKHAWWKISCACPKCDKPMRLVEGAHSSNGQFQFTLVCDDDELVVQWEPFASALHELARDNDLEKDQEGQKGQEVRKQKSKFRGPIEPPLAPAPRSPEPMTNYDEKFLHDVGISIREAKS